MNTISAECPGRIEIVEAEVNLPPMKQEVVLLRLEPLQLQTYNVIQSTIVTNAVDSERTDEDYMFHPRVSISSGLDI
jgi:hypothetical protein